MRRNSLILNDSVTNTTQLVPSGQKCWKYLIFLQNFIEHSTEPLGINLTNDL